MVTRQTPARADIKLDVRLGAPPLAATGGLSSERGLPPPKTAGTASSRDTITDSITGTSSITPSTASLNAALAVSDERAAAARAAGFLDAAAAVAVPSSAVAAAAAGASAARHAAAAAEGGHERSAVVQSEVTLTAVTLGRGGFGEWHGRLHGWLAGWLSGWHESASSCMISIAPGHVDAAVDSVEPVEPVPAGLYCLPVAWLDQPMSSR